ncbi:MAG: hypothetical protein HY239_21610, partial [Mycolicibacterium aromaticivorans]|nr:hypothetical protein [Mycolicibacterium aromaticivorans]
MNSSTSALEHGAGALSNEGLAADSAEVATPQRFASLQSIVMTNTNDTQLTPGWNAGVENHQVALDVPTRQKGMPMSTDVTEPATPPSELKIP